MKGPVNLSQIFGRFAGKEVPMIEEQKEIELKSIGVTQKFTVIRPANDKDPVLEDMRNEAKLHGLRLRVWWEGVVGTMDYRTDRVNAHIEKSGDGKWRVSNRFNLG